jgi:hypothetical protein
VPVLALLERPSLASKSVLLNPLDRFGYGGRPRLAGRELDYVAHARNLGAGRGYLESPNRLRTGREADGDVASVSNDKVRDRLALVRLVRAHEIDDMHKLAAFQAIANAGYWPVSTPSGRI